MTARGIIPYRISVRVSWCTECPEENVQMIIFSFGYHLMEAVTM